MTAATAKAANKNQSASVGGKRTLRVGITDDALAIPGNPVHKSHRSGGHPSLHSLNYNFISGFEPVPVHTRGEHRLWRRQFANPMNNISVVILHVKVDKAVGIFPFY